MQRRVPIVVLASLWLGCSSEAPRNLVLISLDTLVPGRMSAYGNPRETTPTIDGMLDRAVRFENAFSPSPWTLPAHAAMLTGRYPSSLAPDPNDRRLYQLAPLLSTRFKARGYRTAAVTGGPFVGRPFGAHRDFDFFEGGKVERAVSWLEEHHDEPFFLFFHTYEIHAAYRDRRFAEGMHGGRLDKIYTRGLAALGLHAQVCCTGFEPSPEEQRFLLALYDGGIAAADEMVARILSTLRGAGVLDRTTVVITSDHGEEFWEHTGRAAYHGHSLYDELLRVPLIWFEPGLARAGSVRPEPVSLIDIVPTVVARFGLEPAETDGVDLSPLLDGGAWTLERPLFAEGVRHGPERASVRTARGKLIVSGGPQRGEGEKYPVPVLAPQELYLPGDPGELRNDIEARGALGDELRALLEAHRAAGPGQEPAVAQPQLDRTSRERLRALGYVEP